jgi:DNA polymerase IV
VPTPFSVQAPEIPLAHGLTHAANARVLFIDMNSFFASCEQQRNPQWRGKPIAVVSHLHPRGTVLAASYPAKHRGITTGTRIAEARIACPEIILTPVDARLYKSTHQAIVRILHDCYDPRSIQIRSIDEAAIFLGTNHHSSEYAHKLVHVIKQRIYTEIGSELHCSIGIAPNALLAKLATNIQKPNGLTEITLENTPTILSKLSLTDLTGIAQRTADRLIATGIMTPLQLYQSDAATLRSHFGIWGQQWWWKLHGYESTAPDSILRTMSHEHVLQQWVNSRSALQGSVTAMVDTLVHRLHRNEFACRGIWLSLRLADAPRYTQERSFDSPCDDAGMLTQGFTQLLPDLHSDRLPFPVRKIAIGFIGLTPKQSSGTQLSLLAEHAPNHDLSASIAQIRNRFGAHSIITAASLLQHPHRTETVGFGRVKDKHS